MSNRPDAQLARVLFAQPGHVYGDGEGARWRWDGEQWEPLENGHTVLDPDRQTWRIWTGNQLLPAAIDTGAIIRVTWHRDGLDWDRQLCTVVDIERGAEPQLLVEPWPTGTEGTVVPEFMVELVAPPTDSTSS